VDDVSVSERPRRRPNRRGEGSRLRADIVAAAVRLINRAGTIDAVSLRGVAREVGIDPMSVYRHFASKEDLIWAVLDVEFGELARALDAAEEGFADPVERLRARCLTYVSFGLQRRGEFLALFGTEGRPTPPGGHPDQLPGWPVFAGMVNAVQRCLPSEPAASEEAHTQATLLWAGLHGLTVLRISKQGFPWPAVEELVDGLLTSIIGAAF
jgi:AcrR family transcriptional regulator